MIMKLIQSIMLYPKMIDKYLGLIINKEWGIKESVDHGLMFNKTLKKGL